jgi:AraC-like DNA-binding protein
MTNSPASSECTLFESDLLCVIDRRRRGPCAGWGRELGGFPPQIVLTRQGVYACSSGDVIVVTEPLNAKFYDGAHSFRFQRLGPDGEDLTVIRPHPGIVEEAFAGFGYQTAISPELHVSHMRLHARLRRGTYDRLSAEEAVLEMLHEVAEAGGRDTRPIAIGASARRRLDRARASIAVEPEADHRLADVAELAGASPFHFARLFKAHTGYSLRAYRLRLRLAKAVARLSQGEDDLAGLALDLGFSHQSHMTAAFRNVLNTTPSMVRASLAPLH